MLQFGGQQVFPVKPLVRIVRVDFLDVSVVVINNFQRYIVPLMLTVLGFDNSSLTALPVLFNDLVASIANFNKPYGFFTLYALKVGNFRSIFFIKPCKTFPGPTSV